MIYPWLEKSFKRVVGSRKTLPHGVLLTGPKGTGKFSFARELARSLLCGETDDGPSCNACQHCHLFDAGTHPDYHLLINEHIFQTNDVTLVAPGERYLTQAAGYVKNRAKPKYTIGVDQARGVAEELRSTAHYGIGKVVVIYPAEQMNVNAANALLKVLEEPPINTYFLLVTGALYNLPATIRSRCSHYRFPLPSEIDALLWLQEKLELGDIECKKLLDFANGSPLVAFELFSEDAWPLSASFQTDLGAIFTGNASPSAIAKKWGQTDIRTTIGWLQRQMLSAFRAGVVSNATDISREIFNYLGANKCLDLYQRTGMFLQWPPKAVDEVLFLESMILYLFDSRNSAIKQG
jgi:DNA polymerase-3 subunit delta'